MSLPRVSCAALHMLAAACLLTPLSAESQVADPAATDRRTGR